MQPPTYIWNYINQERISWSEDDLEIFSKFINVIQSNKQYLEILKKAVSSVKYQTVLMQSLSDDDKKLLQSFKITLSHLKSSFRLTQANKDFDWEKIKKIKGIPQHYQRNYGKMLRGYHEQTLSNRSLVINCPFTGQIAKSTHSFPINKGIFYRFETEEVFYLISWSVSNGYLIDSIYFPKHELIISLAIEGKQLAIKRMKLVKNLVNKLKSLLIINISELAFYLFISKPKKIITVIGHDNFAHHLFNELEALQRISENGYLENIDQFWVTHAPLGAIEEIFPEIPSNKIKRLKPSKLLNNSLSSSSLIVRIGDKYVSDALRNRIYKVAIKNSKEDLIQLIDIARKSCFPLLWISVRLVNRTCINQQGKSISNPIDKRIVEQSSYSHYS